MALHHKPNIVTSNIQFITDPANLKHFNGSVVIDGITGSPVFNFTGAHTTNSNFFSTNGSGTTLQTDRVSGVGTSTNNLTFSLWVKPLESNGNIMFMSSLSSGSGWNMPPIVAKNGSFRGRLWTGTIVSNAPETAITSQPFSIGNWYNVVLVYDHDNNRTLKLFVNGDLEGEIQNINYDSSGQNNYVWYGKANPGGDNEGDLQAEFSQITIYNNNALNELEVKQNFNALRGRFGI